MRVRVTMTVLLPLLAFGIFLLTPVQPAQAETKNGCTYSGSCYSVGACVQSVCITHEGQKCQQPEPNCDGSWSNCMAC